MQNFPSINLLPLTLLCSTLVWAYEYVPPPTFYYNTGSSGYPTLGGDGPLVGWEYTGNPSDFVLNPSFAPSTSTPMATPSWVQGYPFSYGQGFSRNIYGVTPAYGFGQPRSLVSTKEFSPDKEDGAGIFVDRLRKIFGTRPDLRAPVVDTDRSIPSRDLTFPRGSIPRNPAGHRQ